MREIRNIEWFKKAIAPILSSYKLEYSFFEDGDFGSLNQVEFNSKKLGGSVDFWGLGWLGIFVWDYETENQLLNVLLEPHQEEEKEKAFERLSELLQ